jgi:primosomal protein N' (replication factor Y)
VGFAEVVLNLPVRKGFHYAVPAALEGKVVPGARVAVPFGPQRREGTCVGLHARSPVEKVREIEAVVESIPPVPDELLELTRWMAERYLCSWGQALACAAPGGIHRRGGGSGRKLLHARRTNRRGVSRDAALLKLLEAAGGFMSCAELERAAGVGRAVLKRLEREGFIRLEAAEPELVLPEAELFSEEEPRRLTAEQERALARIEPALGGHRVVLIEGVTASGKTELYIRAIRRVLEQGRQAIFLVPEISLTAQMVGRVRSRLGPVALIHSRMSARMRARQWREAAAGRVPVVMGARSALFTPLPRLGLIVIDEEHDGSYKEHAAPRYHARDVAIERARRAGAAVLLGSATPSIESMHAARSGAYELVRLTRRVLDRPMPRVEIVSMASERRAGLISPALAEAMRLELLAGRQIILYLNRRGFTTSLRCRRCGWLMRCGRCDVVLAHHRALGRALCHYCLKDYALPPICPACNRATPSQFGAGTEKVEAEVSALFPQATVLRMDTDAMRTRGALQEALRKFRDGVAQILVGTKMIAKGLHFPNVTLVGVVNADTAFHLPDFRGAETAFQEVTHVTGRPGRGEHPGHVLIQTFHPKHYAIASAAAHDYAGFYEKELAMRRANNYPPFSSLVRLLFEGRDEGGVRRLAERFSAAVGSAAPSVEVVGPQPAPHYLLRRRYRYHALVKAPDGRVAREAIGRLIDEVPLRGSVELSVDVDPYDSM